MALQTSLLIGLLAVLHVALKNRARAALRYGLWLLLLIKLVLPPTLSSPVSPAYWLPARQLHNEPAPESRLARIEISETEPRPASAETITPAPSANPKLSAAAVAFLVWAAASSS